MGFSVVGLMDSKVLPSTPLTNSPLMKLESNRLDADPFGRMMTMRGEARSSEDAG